MASTRNSFFGEVFEDMDGRQPCCRREYSKRRLRPFLPGSTAARDLTERAGAPAPNFNCSKKKRKVRLLAAVKFITVLSQWLPRASRPANACRCPNAHSYQ